MAHYLENLHFIKEPPRGKQVQTSIMISFIASSLAVPSVQGELHFSQLLYS